MIQRRSLIFCNLLLVVAASWSLPLAIGADQQKSETRSWLGVWLGDAVDGGVQVVALQPGGPADKAGMKSGDIILRANDKEIGSRPVLSRLLEDLEPGDVLSLQVLRSGDVIARQVELGSWETRVRARIASPPEKPAPVSEPRIPDDYRSKFLFGDEPLGVKVTDITPMLREHYGAPNDAGVMIIRIDPNMPGGQAGLAVGDILVRIEGEEISDSSELQERLAGWQGEPLDVHVIRRSEPRAVVVSYESSMERPGESRPTRAEDMKLVQERLRSEIKVLERRLRELQRMLSELENGAPERSGD
jgi:predicted metalloprotease with PDZ domain